MSPSSHYRVAARENHPHGMAQISAAIRSEPLSDTFASEKQPARQPIP